MLHASRHFSPIQGVLPRYTSQHPIGLDSPSHIIWDNHHRTIVPPDLHQIQPRPTQVWNCDENQFDPMVNGARLCVLTSTFKGKECGRCKLESAHHYSAHYLSLPELMGNASCLPSLFTKPRITSKISITTPNWTGQSITHHLATWIDPGGLRPWSNSPTYVLPPLSTIRYYSFMDTIVISTILP